MKGYPQCMGNMVPKYENQTCDECIFHSACFNMTYLTARLERFEVLFRWQRHVLMMHQTLRAVEPFLVKRVEGRRRTT